MSLTHATRWAAIDMHVHLATREWLVDSMGPYQTSVETYFGKALDVKSVEAMADEYRAQAVHGILLAWDAETFTERPPVSNAMVADIARRFPDCFTGFASVDPHRPDALDRIREAHDLGLKGLKLHPTLQGFDPADDQWDPYFRTAAELGLGIISHSGTSGVGARQPGGQGLRLDFCQPIKLDRWAARYPTLRLMLAHAGWPWHLDALAMALHKTNVFIDISGWKYKYLPPEVLREMRTRLAGQFCFGTDYPMFDLATQLQSFQELNLPPDVADKILKGNALSFLGERG